MQKQERSPVHSLAQPAGQPPALLPDPSPSDAKLVQHCLQGNAAAWEELVGRYARLVHSVPVRYGLTAAEVDDVGQEVFLALAQNMHQIEDPERLSAWLITTARRLTWRAVQKRNREQPAAAGDLSDIELPATAQPVTTHVPSIHALFTGWQQQEMISLSMTKLGDRCRDLLRLIFLDAAEPSYAQISAQLGIPLGSIGPTRNRCLQQMRTILEGMGFDNQV
jgi:RNA polymerase sigma factor (sigma-70 family)